MTTMMRMNLYFTGWFYILFAAYMFITPHSFYDATPGVAMRGPFTTHFIRDAGLAMGVSGGALFWGALKLDRAVMIFGTIWPALHAVLHLWVWIARGMPFDFIALVNLTGIQIWAWLGLFCALKLKGAQS
ncbi:MAG: hypothetical protein AAF986_05230 [Pseudomonadota bacterium]